MASGCLANLRRPLPLPQPAPRLAGKYQLQGGQREQHFGNGAKERNDESAGFVEFVALWLRGWFDNINGGNLRLLPLLAVKRFGASHHAVEVAFNHGGENSRSLSLFCGQQGTG